MYLVESQHRDIKKHFYLIITWKLTLKWLYTQMNSIVYNMNWKQQISVFNASEKTGCNTYSIE